MMGVVVILPVRRRDYAHYNSGCQLGRLTLSMQANPNHCNIYCQSTYPKMLVKKRWGGLKIYTRTSQSHIPPRPDFQGFSVRSFPNCCYCYGYPILSLSLGCPSVNIPKELRGAEGVLIILPSFISYLIASHHNQSLRHPLTLRGQHPLPAGSHPSLDLMAFYPPSQL